MRFWLTVLLIQSHFLLLSQENSLAKFGSVQPQHFRAGYETGNNAPAVVLFDKGHTKIQGNSKGWFSASFTRHKVFRVLKKEGFEEANIELLLLKKGENEEKLEELKAVTYNLQKGKVSATKLERKDIYRSKAQKNAQVIRFTMPAVQEGSVIEFEYRVTSDYYWQIDPWYFQNHLPTLWSEYVFSVPQFFTYTFMYKGYQPFWVTEKKESRDQFIFTNDRTTGSTQRSNFSAAVTDFRWVKKDVPPIKEEVFISSLQNNIAKIEFSLTAQTEPLDPRDFRNTWKAIAEELTEAENFGKAVDNAKGWLTKELDLILPPSITKKEAAAKIYAYVRDHFHCTNEKGISIETPLKKVFKDKTGNVAEINLLLLAMLQSAGIEANPVLLSRTVYGRIYENYPGLSQFNYVVVQASIDGQETFLDASRKLGFGKLLEDCYNGHALIVAAEGKLINLVPDSLEERKITVLTLTQNGEGSLTGKLAKTAGYFESYALRKIVLQNGEKSIEHGMAKNAVSGLSYVITSIDSLQNLEAPVAVRSNVKSDFGSKEIVYLDPLFGEGLTHSPFTSTDRLHPVEMPYTIDETFVLSLDIPTGYVLQELPKQLMAKFDAEGKSFFEYRVETNGRAISLRSRIKLARAYFEPEEYQSLQQFFYLIASKHNERIVLKKQ